MQDLKNFFEPLKKEDIEEKIKLNLDKGISLEQLRLMLYDELFKHERLLLKTENSLMMLKIQVQNLKEQIKVTEEKINIANDKLIQKTLIKGVGDGS